MIETCMAILRLERFLSWVEYFPKLNIIFGRPVCQDDGDLYGNLDVGKVPHSYPTPVLLRLRHLLLLEQVRLEALLYIRST